MSNYNLFFKVFPKFVEENSEKGCEQLTRYFIRNNKIEEYYHYFLTEICLIKREMLEKKNKEIYKEIKKLTDQIIEENYYCEDLLFIEKKIPYWMKRKTVIHCNIIKANINKN